MGKRNVKSPTVEITFNLLVYTPLDLPDKTRKIRYSKQINKIVMED